MQHFKFDALPSQKKKKIKCLPNGTALGQNSLNSFGGKKC